MKKIRIASQRLQFVVLVFMVLTPVAAFVSVITNGWSDLLYLPAGLDMDLSRVTGFALLAMVLLGALTPVSHLIAFAFLYKLLGLYKQGVIFAAVNVASIRQIGWALIAIDLVHMVQILLTGPVLTLLEISPPYVSAGIRIAFLVVGLFIVLVSYVIDMGRKLEEQDRLVI